MKKYASEPPLKGPNYVDDVVHIEDVLTFFDLRKGFKESQDSNDIPHGILLGPCPFGHDTNPTQFRVSREANHWFCTHPGCGDGTPSDFLMRRYNIASPLEAQRKLAAMFDLVIQAEPTTLPAIH